MGKIKKKAGFVVLIGRPNVGKSTLLNNLLDKKVSIISNIPQTTRFSIRGILNEARGQIIIVDTPGIFLSNKRLTKFLSKRAFSTKDEADLILYMVDISRAPGKEENEILEKLHTVDKPVIMVLNKRDLGQTHAGDYIELWKERVVGKNDPLKYFIPISALNKKGLDELLDLIFENLPESEPLYPEDIISDLPERLLTADIVREKIFNLTYEEVPHSVAVRIDNIEERNNNLVYIQATILVERKSQRAIIIGKKGETLRKIGESARKELESNYNKKVFLDLWIKVYSDWQKNNEILKQLGYMGSGLHI